jgi:hypothetical protein
MIVATADGYCCRSWFPLLLRWLGGALLTEIRPGGPKANPRAPTHARSGLERCPPPL